MPSLNRKDHLNDGKTSCFTFKDASDGNENY